MTAEKFGNYVLYELLGRGGMGEVHRAYDTSRKRTVALKRLPTSLARDDAFRRRFRTESEVAARLTEPHVLPVHDYGEIDGRLFLDMRYVEGPDLGSHLEQHGRLGPTEAVSVVEQIAAALDAAHADGLVHRDVKPSNVLVTLSGTGAPAFAYLSDFGVAQIGGSDTGLSTTNATVGTLDYMAPERYVTRRADLLVDVYSLGCVLFEVLVGAKPFPSQSLPEAMHAHLSRTPPRPSEQVEGLSAEMDEVVARAMAKEPSERFSTCGELAAAARSALEGARVVPQPDPDAEQDPLPESNALAEVEAEVRSAPSIGVGTTRAEETPTRSRRPVLVGAAAIALALVLALSAFAALRGGGTPADAAPATPTTSPTTAPSVVTPPTVSSNGLFAGRSSGNEITVALAVQDGKVAAYLCDGKAIESWFEGTISGAAVELTNPKGSSVRADLSTDAALGTMTVNGRTLPFSAQRAAPPAGLYSARQGSSRIGWIVLPDGDQVGTRKDGETLSPAPPLEASSRSATVDGQAVTAAPVVPGVAR